MSRLLSLLLLCALAVPAGAAPPPTPAALDRRVDAGLDRCIRALRCDANPCASNGGLKACFGDAAGTWDEQTARLEGMLARRDPWCATYWNELKDKHAAFGEDAMTSKSLADGPYNTDDDLQILLARQRYEMAYAVLANSACWAGKR